MPLRRSSARARSWLRALTVPRSPLRALQQEGGSFPQLHRDERTRQIASVILPAMKRGLYKVRKTGQHCIVMHPASDMSVLMIRAARVPIVQTAAVAVVTGPKMAMYCSWPKVRAERTLRPRQVRTGRSRSRLAVAARAHALLVSEARLWWPCGATAAAVKVALAAAMTTIATAFALADSLLLLHSPHAAPGTSTRLSSAQMRQARAQ